MATDAVECCSLARRLALRLTDGLPAGIISTTENAGGIRLHTTVDIADGAGEKDRICAGCVPWRTRSHPPA